MIAVEVSGPAVPRLSRGEIASFVRRVVRAVECSAVAPFGSSEVSIAFIDDGEMTKLNRRYRRKSGTTDILTFPGDPCELVISLDQARGQARRDKHTLATEVRYLVVHGLLHAFGYDHETDRGEMNALELQIRAAVGLE